MGIFAKIGLVLAVVFGASVGWIARPLDWIVVDLANVTPDHQWGAVYSHDTQHMAWFDPSRTEVCIADRWSDSAACAPVPIPDGWRFNYVAALAPQDGTVLLMLISTDDYRGQMHMLVKVADGTVRHVETVRRDKPLSFKFWTGRRTDELYKLALIVPESDDTTPPTRAQVLKVGPSEDTLLFEFDVPWYGWSLPVAADFSADGSQLAFTMNAQADNVWVLDLESGLSRSYTVPFSESCCFGAQVAWGPTGRTLSVLHRTSWDTWNLPTESQAHIIDTERGDITPVLYQAADAEQEQLGYGLNTQTLTPDGRYAILVQAVSHPNGFLNSRVVVVSLDAAPANEPVTVKENIVLFCGESVFTLTLADHHQRRDYVVPVYITCGMG